MERLEACYFCGTAEDAPLREVTVTPRSRQGDPDAAVSLTLCRSCERKLERVLSGLFDHVESRQSSGKAPEDGEPTTEDTETQNEAEPIDRIDVASSGSEEPAQGRRELFTDPPVTADESTAEGDDSPEPTEDDAEIIEEETVTAKATVNSKEALDGVSVSEYNKVMRLLQNRDFPMARAAFVDLAANAYDLAEETVERVLETVIEQGGLTDRDGELVRPGQEESA